MTSNSTVSNDYDKAFNSKEYLKLQKKNLMVTK